MLLLLLPFRLPGLLGVGEPQRSGEGSEAPVDEGGSELWVEEDVGRVSDEVLVGVEPELVRRGGDAAMPLAPTHDHPLQLVVEACNELDDLNRQS